MSNTFNITKHNSKAQTAPFTVEDTITLSAFRVIAEREGVMTAQDHFKIGKSGIVLPKASEDKTIWTDIQDPEDKSIHIVTNSIDFTAKDGLTESEKQFLLEKSRIGFGFEATEDGPKYTSRQVIADLSPPHIAFVRADKGERDVVTTHSSRSSAYLQAGWVDASLTAKTPWESGGVQASLSLSSTGSESQKRIYVTGRYTFSHATISIKDCVSQLKPDPKFKKAVDDALKISDERGRSKAVQRLLNWYGTMFVTSVEVGGMKHSTIERVLDDETTESSIKAQVSLKVGEKFGPSSAEAQVGGGVASTQSQAQEGEFSSTQFHTVGGMIEAQSIHKWIESLSSPLNWGVTKVLEVQSVFSLFDKETQEKLALAFFKAPIYLFRNKGKRHCLSMNPDPTKLFVNKDGKWESLGPLGRVLTVPIDGAVPLYDLYNGIRHRYTPTPEERNREIIHGGYSDVGIICYVYPDQRPGTHLTSRTWKGDFTDGDNGYAVTESQRSVAIQEGYGIEDNFHWYSYPL